MRAVESINVYSKSGEQVTGLVNMKEMACSTDRSQEDSERYLRKEQEFNSF